MPVFRSCKDGCCAVRHQGKVALVCFRRVPRTRSMELGCSVTFIRGMFYVGVGLVVLLTLVRRWVSDRALLLSRVLTQDMNLARFCLFAYWDDQAEHAVVVGGGSEDVVIVNRFLPDIVASDVSDYVHVSVVTPWMQLLPLCFSALHR